MSLLNKATIITTPTAHSNGTLHSIKGGEVADFDVVRGSAATRVNAEGLIEDISVLSEELVSNGDFSNGSTDWTLGTGWSIGENKAICEANGGFDVLNQGFVLNSGNSYKVTYTADLSLITSGTLKLGTFGNSVSERTILDGTNTAYLTASGTSFAINEGGAIGTATITNISVIEITDDTNIPRIDYTTGEGVVLLEPQSTNLIPYSNDYADAYWIKATSGSGIAPIVTSNYAISPDGTQNADRIQFNATTSGSNSDRSRIRTTLTLSDVTDYTFSFYAKSTDGTDQKIGILFDNSQISLKTITSEWQRFEATAQQSETSSICGLDLRGGSASTSDILVYGIQIEQQSYATSYIPTSGAIATRLADSLTGAGDATTFNSTEGVLYVEMAALTDGGSNRYISLLNGTHRISILFRTLSGRIRVDGTSFSVIEAQGIPQDNNNKIAVSYSSSGVKLFVNGVLEDSNTDNPNFPTNSLSSLDFELNGTLPLYGKVKALAVFNEALTDSELECLTTI